MKLERVRAVRKRSRWFDGLLTHNPVLVGGMAIPFAVVITTSLKNSVSISILLTLCGRYADSRRKPVFALVDAVSYSAGFALIMCLLALLREWLGTGHIWGVPVRAPFTLSGIQITFTGFILLALLSAAARFLRRAALLLIYRRDNPRTAPPSA